MDIQRKADDLERVKELSYDLQSVLNVSLSTECFKVSLAMGQLAVRAQMESRPGLGDKGL